MKENELNKSNSLRIVRTNALNADFIRLVHQLDLDLAEKDGEDHAFYSQYNTLENIQQVVLIYRSDEALSCGAIKEYRPSIMEIKRMFTIPSERGKGLASMVLNELELRAKELGYAKCILETGLKQQEAIALYQKRAYRRIPNYGQYQGVENSWCFEKEL